MYGKFDSIENETLVHKAILKTKQHISTTGALL